MTESLFGKAPATDAKAAETTENSQAPKPLMADDFWGGGASAALPNTNINSAIATPVSEPVANPKITADTLAPSFTPKAPLDKEASLPTETTQQPPALAEAPLAMAGWGNTDNTKPSEATKPIAPPNTGFGAKPPTHSEQSTQAERPAFEMSDTLHSKASPEEVKSFTKTIPEVSTSSENTKTTFETLPPPPPAIKASSELAEPLADSNNSAASVNASTNEDFWSPAPNITPVTKTAAKTENILEEKAEKTVETTELKTSIEPVASQPIAAPPIAQKRESETTQTSATFSYPQEPEETTANEAEKPIAEQAQDHMTTSISSHTEPEAVIAAPAPVTVEPALEPKPEISFEPEPETKPIMMAEPEPVINTPETINSEGSPLTSSVSENTTNAVETPSKAFEDHSAKEEDGLSLSNRITPLAPMPPKFDLANDGANEQNNLAKTNDEAESPFDGESFDVDFSENQPETQLQAAPFAQETKPDTPLVNTYVSTDETNSLETNEPALNWQAAQPVAENAETPALEVPETLETPEVHTIPQATVEAESNTPKTAEPIAVLSDPTELIQETIETNDTLEEIELDNDLEDNAILEAATATASAAVIFTVEHQQQRDNLILDHRKWLDSQGAEGRRAVFRDLPLMGQDFSGQRLEGATFRGLDLSNCKFIGAHCAETDFSTCDLSHTDFSNAHLNAAIFHEAVADDANFTNAEMIESDFSQASLHRTNFSHVTADNSSFRDTEALATQWQQASLRLANFRGAIMSGAQFMQADLSQAIMREVDLSDAKFHNAGLVQTNFRDANFEGIDLNSTDFSQALDISGDIQNDFIIAEREKMMHEKQRLESIQNELEQRERHLIQEREQLQKQLHLEKNKQPEAPAIDGQLISGEFKKASRLFLAFGVGWFILAFLVTLIISSVLSEMSSNEISVIEWGIMMVLMVAPLILFGLSMMKSFSLSYKLRKLFHHEPHEPE